MTEAPPAAPYALAVFDFDGTLADSFPWFAGVLNGVADRYGFRCTRPGEAEGLRGLWRRAPSSTTSASRAGSCPSSRGTCGAWRPVTPTRCPPRSDPLLARQSRMRITASISTGTSEGSEPMPTAERAWRPRSPSTSTNRLEQASITLGWSP